MIKNIKEMTAEEKAATIHDVARLEADIFTDAWSEALLTESYSKYDYYEMYVISEDAAVEDETLEVSKKQNASSDSKKDRLLAYIIFTNIAGDGDLCRVAVDPSARKKGLGKTLLNSMEENLRRKSAEKVMLEVRAANEPARQMYLADGFEEIFIRKGYYTNPVDDAVIMQKFFPTKEVTEKADQVLRLAGAQDVLEDKHD